MNTFMVIVTPARENAGEHDVSSDVASIPDDIDFLTMYTCTEFDGALGYFDEVVELLGRCSWDAPEWLDNFNRCLTIGYIAQVSIYQVSPKNNTLLRMANTAITVGGEIPK
jgi:hypothetical protein